jgi:hypothetical protein
MSLKNFFQALETRSKPELDIKVFAVDVLSGANMILL